MDGYFLILGIILGLSLAAPVGPIGILVIRRTFTYGRLSGLATGFGAATADGLYAVTAASGLTVIVNIRTGYLSLIQVLGGIILVYLGIRIFLSLPSWDYGIVTRGSLQGDYATAVLLTLTNPMTLLSFTGIFAALGTGTTGGNTGAVMLIAAGIIAGSVLWWLVLVSGISAFRSRCDRGIINSINKISGLVIIAFGIAGIASSVG